MTRTPVVLAAFLIACSAPTEEPPPPQPAAKSIPASIRTDRTRYVLEHALFGPEATIVATFTAPKDRTVYLLNCNGALSTGLQRRVADAWVNAWGAVINGCMSQPIVVLPGGEHVDRIVIRPGAGAVIHPPDGRELIEPGTYRVVWHFALTSFDMNARPHGDDLPLEQRVSAPIVIEAAAPRPAAITAIEPTEGARVAAIERVRLAFDFSRAAIRLKEGSLRLHVDGNDVTDQTTTAATDDVPSSHVEMTFTPRQWESGRHTIKVDFRDERGRLYTYSWAFTIDTTPGK